MAVTRQPRVYKPYERPDVEVLVDGDWLVGELRQWKPLGETDWIAEVQWRPAGSHTRRIDDFEPARVRPVEDDGRLTR